MGHILGLPLSGIVKTPPFFGSAADTEFVKPIVSTRSNAPTIDNISQLFFVEFITPPFYTCSGLTKIDDFVKSPTVPPPLNQLPPVEDPEIFSGGREI